MDDVLATEIGGLTVTAADAARALRAALRNVFDDAGAAVPAWLDFSAFSHQLQASFGLPKDLDLRYRLLWTAQTQARWEELAVPPSGFDFRGQILAGPSGIGKSHILFLLAARSFAMGMPTLFVPDAGVLVTSAVASAEAHPSIAMSVVISKRLLATFLAHNADVVSSTPRGLSASLMQLLSLNKAVVIIDEHGHAYDELEKLSRTHPSLCASPAATFPLLMPNSYLGNYNTRTVLGGSNQANFELSLNGTYLKFMRFVVPPSVAEGRLLWEDLVTRVGVAQPRAFDDDIVRVTNCVPRELVHLSVEAKLADYIANRRSAMGVHLTRMADRLETGTSRASMVRTLDDLFRVSTMAMGIEDYSFLDLGFVYRRGGGGRGRLTAVPLCLPATLALLGLWEAVSESAAARLASVKVDGGRFVEFVWGALLVRGFRDTDAAAALQCENLDGTETELLPLRLDFYSTSQLSYHESRHAEVVSELSQLRALCVERQQTALYRCPRGCDSVDFFIVRRDGTCCAIQTSISKLLDHESGNSIAALAAKYSLTETALFRYVYVTVKPTQHPQLAARADLSHVRIVSANDWIGV